MIRPVRGWKIDLMKGKDTLQLERSPLLQSGIEERNFRLEQVRLCEITNIALARLRSMDAPPDPQASALDVPVQTGQCAGSDPVFLCLGPREWLAVSATSSPDRLRAQLQAVTQAARGMAVFDASDALATLRLAGAAAPWLLSKLGGLDFLAGTQEGQHCTRTRLGEAAVTIHYHLDAQQDWVFDVFSDRSIAAYLWALFLASAPHANELAQTHGAAA
jgi:heterotetrameric sarcosine oxidase gamma subunit